MTLNTIGEMLGTSAVRIFGSNSLRLQLCPSINTVCRCSMFQLSHSPFEHDWLVQSDRCGTTQSAQSTFEAATESSPCTSKLSGLQRTAAAGCFHAMLRMSALLLAVGLAALIIAGIITGALRLVHHGNAGQLLPRLVASVNSSC